MAGSGNDNSEVKSALRQAFGSYRVKTAPVSGRSLIKTGLGVAMGGLHPVVAIDADFCLDTLRFTDFDHDCQVASADEICVPLVVRAIKRPGSIPQLVDPLEFIKLHPYLSPI